MYLNSDCKPKHIFLFCTISIELLESKNPPSHFPHPINEPVSPASISKIFLESIHFFPCHIFSPDHYVSPNWPDFFRFYLNLILPTWNLPYHRSICIKYNSFRSWHSTAYKNSMWSVPHQSLPLIAFHLSTTLQLHRLPFWSSKVLSSFLFAPLYLLFSLSGQFSGGWLVPVLHLQNCSTVTSLESLITLSKQCPTSHLLILHHLIMFISFIALSHCESTSIYITFSLSVSSQWNIHSYGQGLCSCVHCYTL